MSNWTSTCQGTSCGTGGTADSILFANTSGAAFNGGNGLWTNGQSGLLSNSPVPNSPSGGNFVAFDGDISFNASISQQIAGLTAGNTYVLTFYQAAAQQNGTDGATTEHWQVTFNGQTKSSTTMNNLNHGWVPWTQQTLTFTAGSTLAQNTLTFLALGTPTGQPPVVLLDGVSLQSAPEPQTFALVGLGLVAIPWLTRRRRKQ